MESRDRSWQSVSLMPTFSNPTSSLFFHQHPQTIYVLFRISILLMVEDDLHVYNDVAHMVDHRK